MHDSPSPDSVSTDSALDRAIALAARNVADGGGPFGAIVVAPDGREFAGVNRVTRDNDPTAHAEVVAIRIAARELGTFDLTGCVLYASCEPCPLCLSAALWARLDRVEFAADRHDAARAGFDDAVFYDLFDTPRDQWPTRVEQAPSASAAAPFDAWRENAERVEY